MALKLSSMALSIAIGSYSSGALAVDCKPISSIATTMPDRTSCLYLKRFPFTDQNDPGRRVDARVKDAMGIQDLDDQFIRSYAFVVSVWNYHFPGIRDSDLKAVEREQADILRFIREQGFDEAVVLNNSEATSDAIRKLLTEYFLPQFSSKSLLGTKIRFMFIFDGHGWRPPSDEGVGALALSDLEDEGDLKYDHRFSLAELRGLLQDLAPYTQSMIALLGSCYSGSVFVGKAVADDVKPGPSAWIATAVPRGWTEAWALPDNKGTIFFQDLITTVENWTPSQPSLPEDDSIAEVDFRQYMPKLRQIVDAINEKHAVTKNRMTGEPYPSFEVDTIAVDGQRNSPFRFIVPANPTRVKGVDFLSSRFSGSSVVGHPEVSVVHTEGYYKIKGLYFNSSESGDLDFAKLRSDGIRFAYLPIPHETGADSLSFEKARVSAVDSGVALGPIYQFSLCDSAESQFQTIKSALPESTRLLPFVVALDWKTSHLKEKLASECGDIISARSRLHRLLVLIENQYKSRPVIHIGEASSQKYSIIDDSFEFYPVWISIASRQFSSNRVQRKPVSNPWTFWQYDANATLQSFPGQKFDLNLFFGTEQDFSEFTSEGKNIALEAAVHDKNIVNIVNNATHQSGNFGNIENKGTINFNMNVQ